MAWQDEMGEVLRVMVQDLNEPPTYPDDTVQRVILVAAQLVEGELTFSTTYQVDITDRDITPDPTDRDGGTRDDNFVNLVCMKAAAIIDQGVVRQQSGIVIRDNGSMVDLRAKLAAALKLVQLGWARTYEEEKFRYQAGLLGGGVAGAVVLGPFRAIARDLYGWSDGYNPGDVSPRSADYLWVS